MIKLDATNEATLLRLSSKSSLDDVQAALEDIARRHSVEWPEWLDWKPSLGWPPLLSWLATEFESGAYEAVLAFAFNRFLPAITEHSRMVAVADHFCKSLHALSLSINRDDAAAEAADMRAKEAAAIFLISAGHSGVRIAFCSLNAMMSGSHGEWLDFGWRKADSAFQALAYGSASTTPAISGKKPPL